MLPLLRVLATSDLSDLHVADTEYPLKHCLLRPEAQIRMVQGLATRVRHWTDLGPIPRHQYLQDDLGQAPHLSGTFPSENRDKGWLPLSTVGDLDQVRSAYQCISVAPSIVGAPQMKVTVVADTLG